MKQAVAAGKVADSWRKKFEENLVGQRNTVKAFYPYVDNFFTGLKIEGRPQGIFLLAGTTGSGKSYSVESLAAAIHGSSSYMLRLDCAEFQLEHEIAKLIGAAPGYLGHRETVPFLAQQKIAAATSERSNMTIILLDEIEKAHPSFQRLMLGIFDKGILKTCDGNTTKFDNAMIFMTSNLGAGEMQKIALGNNIGFEKQAASRSAYSDRVNHAVRKHFSPEFVNRIDEVLMYEPLKDADFERICRTLVETFRARVTACFPLSDLHVTDDAIKWLAKTGTSQMFGARELKRVIFRELETPVGEYIRKHKGDVILRMKAALRDDRLVIMKDGKDESPRSIEFVQEVS